MAINVRQTFDPTGTMYPNYLQQQYMSRTILPPPGSQAASTTPPPAANSGSGNGGGASSSNEFGGKNLGQGVTTYRDPNGREFVNYNPATGQGDPAPAVRYDAQPGTVIGRDANGNPILVSRDTFNGGNVARLSPLTGDASHVAYDSTQGADHNVGITMDRNPDLSRVSTATAGAQDALMASAANGGQGRTPRFFSDGVAIFGDGGIIPEPVVGRGLYSGKPYIFGEKGPEGVIPNDQMPEHMQEQGGHGAYADGGTIGFRPQNGPTPSPQQGPAPITPMANPNAASRVARAVRGRSRNPYQDPYLNRQFLDEGRSAMHNPVQFSVNGRNYTTFTDAAGQRHVRDEASGHTVPLGVISDMGIQQGGVSDGGVVDNPSVVGDSGVVDSGGPTLSDLMGGFNNPSQYDQQNPFTPPPPPAPAGPATAPTTNTSGTAADTGTIAPTDSTTPTTDTSGTVDSGLTSGTGTVATSDGSTTAPTAGSGFTVSNSSGYNSDGTYVGPGSLQFGSGAGTLSPDDVNKLLSQ